MRLVIDTNIIFSALIKDSITRRILLISKYDFFIPEYVFIEIQKHVKDIEYIAIVGAHSWTKFMSEILADSIFVEAVTHYFKPEELEDAWFWLGNASHPKHIPVRRVINSDKGLFTKYSSPDYI